MCNNGKVVMSTRDHKPFDNDERDRIEAAGGHVFMRRVDGDLAVSRALGDFQYKDANLPAARCKVGGVLINGWGCVTIVIRDTSHSSTYLPLPDSSSTFPGDRIARSFTL